MIISGQFVIPAARDAVFARIQDARFFASCVDGVKEMTEIDPTHYNAILETRVAYIRFRFDIAVEVTRMEAPNLIEAKLQGAPIGIVGRFASTALTELSEVEGGTEVRYTIDAALTGKLGSLGQPVVKSKARDMEKQFVKNLTAAFTEPSEELPPAEETRA